MNLGNVVEVIGAVVDVEFDRNNVPKVYDALRIDQEDITLDQIRAYYPLSIMSLFNAEAVPDKYLYPFKALNLFEVTSWIMMVYGVHAASGKRFNISAYIVGFSYVLFFLIWLGFYTMIYK